MHFNSVHMPSCVIVVENLPVPFDRRVWQEAQALHGAGWEVSVICPTSRHHHQRFEVIDGISIYRHPLPTEARYKLGFLFEYSAALAYEALLLFKIALTRGFDVIQICNPPDLLFINALPYKLFGKRLVFDHHDVCPELFSTKFARKGLLHWLLLVAEKLTVKSANVVISANETFRNIVIERCGKSPDDVITVYSVPDLSRVKRVPPNQQLRNDARVVLGYVGIISDQDGVDHLVRMMHHLVVDYHCREIGAVIVGDGPALPEVRQLACDLNLQQHITFTGYLRGDDLLAALSCFDIGIIPDPVNEYNDKISMNKVFEYSALGVPTVAYALSETRRLLGDIARYAEGTTPADLARACLPLINDDDARVKLGEAAKVLADECFDWARERAKYLGAYQRLTNQGK
jgi:glycosyltransferase involved in cell wall biosynthesis